MQRLVKFRIKQTDAFSSWLTLAKEELGAIKGSATLAELLRRPSLHVDHLIDHGLADARLGHDVLEAAEIEIKLQAIYNANNSKSKPWQTTITGNYRITSITTT